MLLQAERDQRTGGVVRALSERDVPALVALRRSAFRHSERATAGALTAFFHTVFFQNPWRDPEIPSLVYENARGEVAGFLGSLPRRMTLEGRVLRVGVGTQLMVSPGDRGLAGRRLMRAYMDGPQDLSLGDTANDAARRLWSSLGGLTSQLLSTNWVYRLRPWRHALQRLGRGRAASFARAIAAPFTALLDGRPNGDAAADSTASRLEALTPEAMCQDQEEVLGSFALRPVYEPGSLSWMLALAAEKRQFGALYSARVRSARGAPDGWFLYYFGADGVAHVLQIAARQRRESVVLARLFRDALDRGAVAVCGRAEPWLMPALLGADGVFVYRGPWTLLHSRRAEVSALVERTAGYLSRLDGEWWLSF